jgi:prepilin-type N-terminal cleavage/methylation domain-containing protein
MFQRAMDKKRQGEAGFTLVELLVVIVILAILAAVVVFAVGGITNKGNQSACEADTSALATAEEAYFANNNQSNYTNMQGLVDGKFIHKASTLHTISVAGDSQSYTIGDVSGKCSDNS